MRPETLLQWRALGVQAHAGRRPQDHDPDATTLEPGLLSSDKIVPASDPARLFLAASHRLSASEVS